MATASKNDKGGRNLIRIFVAIDMPTKVKDEIRKIQGELKEKKLFEGRFINPDDAHLTIQFIGYIEPIALPPIKKLLDPIKFDPISAKLGKMGTFGSNGFVRVVWLEIIGEGLLELAHKIEKALSIGTSSLHKPFQAHITIARVKKSEDFKALKQAVEEINVEPLEFKIDSFVLKQSTLTSNGPIYVDLKNYPE